MSVLASVCFEFVSRLDLCRLGCGFGVSIVEAVAAGALTVEELASLLFH